MKFRPHKRPHGWRDRIIGLWPWSIVWAMAALNAAAWWIRAR